MDWDPRHLYRLLFDDEGEMEEFLATVCTPEWHAAFDGGRSIAEGIDELVERRPDRAPLIRAYAERWDDMFAGEIPGTARVLEELDERGVRLFAITNWPAETFPAARERFGFLARFAGIVVSGEERVTKPDTRLFTVLIERHGVEPARSLFVDDTQRHLDAAARMGFSTQRFTDAAALRDRLARERLLPG